MKNKSKASKRNPKRGGPGFLLCCETGREIKCQREALDILNYYYFQVAMDGTNDSAEKSSTIVEDDCSQNEGHSKEWKKSLSMEEEIALLKSGVSADVLLNDDKRNESQTKNTKYKNPFQLYETGCRGTAFLMYNQAKYDRDKDVSENEADNSDHVKDELDKKRSFNQVGNDVATCNSGRTKKQKHENGIDFTISSSTTLKKWDPLETARSVISDLIRSSSLAPSSRFVTRMIPIQLTCFANMEEIRLTSNKLIKQLLLPFGIEAKNDRKERPTFKIELKKRICSSIKRDAVISAVADSIQVLTDEYFGSCVNEKVSPELKRQEKSLFCVDLNNAEYTIIIEVCRTLVGMSVVKDAKWFKNFNLTIIKGENQSTG